MAAIGVVAGGAALWRSLELAAYLRNARERDLPAPRVRLIGANRLEIVRDLMLVGGLSFNLIVGLAAALTQSAPQSAGRAITQAISALGLLVGATLFAGFAVLNFWYRYSMRNGQQT